MYFFRSKHLSTCTRLTFSSVDSIFTRYATWFSRNRLITCKLNALYNDKYSVARSSALLWKSKRRKIAENEKWFLFFHSDLEVYIFKKNQKKTSNGNEIYEINTRVWYSYPLPFSLSFTHFYRIKEKLRILWNEWTRTEDARQNSIERIPFDFSCVLREYQINSNERRKKTKKKIVEEQKKRNCAWQIEKERERCSEKKKQPISQDQLPTSSLVSILSLAMLAGFDSIMPSPVRCTGIKIFVSFCAKINEKEKNHEKNFSSKS